MVIKRNKLVGDGRPRPSVFNNQTNKGLAKKGTASVKARDPDFRRLCTALRQADMQLTHAMKEFQIMLKDSEADADFVGVDESALNGIHELFETVRSHCEEDLNRPLALEIIGFATEAEHEMCRFVTERSLLCQKIVDSLEALQIEEDNKAAS